VTLGVRPEIVNRIDAVVAFRPLDSDARRHIAVNILVDTVAAYGLQLRWAEPDVLSAILTVSDPAFGARDIRRSVERTWAEPLARYARDASETAVTLSLSSDRRPLVMDVGYTDRPQTSGNRPTSQE